MPAWDYDLIIIGGGPAGLTAGIYAGRARLCAVMLEKLMHGGQMMTADLVENYSGFPEGISGFELSERLRQQAERFECAHGERRGLGESFPASRCTLQSWKAGGDHAAHRLG